MRHLTPSLISVAEKIRFGAEPGYRLGRTMHTEWNENADFELLYPYVWADSVGGNLISERYAFAGGFAREFGRVAWGIYADYRAEIEYRTVDPRPKSVVSDLNLSTGATLSLGECYRLGTSVNLRVYRQKSSMTFMRRWAVPSYIRCSD